MQLRNSLANRSRGRHILALSQWGYILAPVVFLLTCLLFAPPAARAQDGNTDPVKGLEAVVQNPNNSLSGCPRDSISFANVIVTVLDSDNKPIHQAGIAVGISVDSPGAVNFSQGTTNADGQVIVQVHSTDISPQDASVKVSVKHGAVTPASATVGLYGLKVMLSSNKPKIYTLGDPSHNTAILTAGVADSQSEPAQGIVTFSTDAAKLSSLTGQLQNGSASVTLAAGSGDGAAVAHPRASIGPVPDTSKLAVTIAAPSEVLVNIDPQHEIASQNSQSTLTATLVDADKAPYPGATSGATPLQMAFSWALATTKQSTSLSIPAPGGSVTSVGPKPLLHVDAGQGTVNASSGSVASDTLLLGYYDPKDDVTKINIFNFLKLFVENTKDANGNKKYHATFDFGKYQVIDISNQ